MINNVKEFELKFFCMDFDAWKNYISNLNITIKQYDLKFITKSCFVWKLEFHTLSCNMAARVQEESKSRSGFGKTRKVVDIAN